MFKSSALKLNDSMLRSVVGGAAGPGFRETPASKAKFAKPISSTANVFGFRAHDGHARLTSRATRAAARAAPRGHFRRPAACSEVPFLNTVVGTRRVRPVHMLHQCAICTMMPHAHSGTVQ